MIDIMKKSEEQRLAAAIEKEEEELKHKLEEEEGYRQAQAMIEEHQLQSRLEKA